MARLNILPTFQSFDFVLQFIDSNKMKLRIDSFKSFFNFLSLPLFQFFFESFYFVCHFIKFCEKPSH